MSGPAYGQDISYCRDCCGKRLDAGPPEGCDCDLELISGDDFETGPWEHVVCYTHSETHRRPA